MSSNEKRPVIMLEADVMARLAKSWYGGAKVVYDDKAVALEMLRYSVFWKARKNFLIGLEYSQSGDRKSIEGTFNHKINIDT